MSFFLRRILFILSFLILTGVLTYLGFNRSSKTEKGRSVSSEIPVSYSREILISEEMEHLDSASRDSIQKLEEFLSTISGEKRKIFLQELGGRWIELERPWIGAFYFKDVADSGSSWSSWAFAGDLFFEGFTNKGEDPSAAFYLGEATKAYEKALYIDTGNLDVKNKLALTYFYSDDVMKGVQMLKEVLARDSNNIQALYQLGIKSIESGHFDKAIIRFEKLVSLQPANPEFQLHLAETYMKHGDNQKAVIHFQKVRLLVKDEEARKEIDKILNKLNQSN